MFVLRIPSTRVAERSYAAGVLLGEFLGLDYRIEKAESNLPVRLFAESDPTAGIVFGDNLFCKPESEWLTACSLPIEPLARYLAPASFGRAGSEAIPILYPSSSALIPNKNDLSIDFDLFGSAF